MKKITWLWTLCALLVVIGMMGVACDNGNKPTGDNNYYEEVIDDEGNKTWVKTDKPVAGGVYYTKDGKPKPFKGNASGTQHTIVNETSEAKTSDNGGYLSITPAREQYGFNVKITATPQPESGWEISYVEIQLDGSQNWVRLNRASGVYTFQMPDANVIVRGKFKESTPPERESIVFKDGLQNDAKIYEQVNQERGDGTITGDGASVVADEGRGGGTQAIKIDVSKVTDFYVLGLQFDIDCTKYNGLRVDAKLASGATSLKPAFDQIIFGEAGTDKESLGDRWYNIKNAVRYAGDWVDPTKPRESTLTLAEKWKTFIVPITTLDKRNKINVIQLFFTPPQIENGIVYLDNIYFVQNEGGNAELTKVQLPASGEIPWKDSSGEELKTRLDVLTMATNLVYEYNDEEYTYFGENPDYNRTEFFNTFTDWFGAANIAYSGTGVDNSANPKTIKADSNGQTITLNVTYPKGSSTVASTAPMTVKSLGAMTVFTAGTPIHIDGLELLAGKPYMNAIPLPHYWGSNAGDAQWNGEEVHMYMSNITIPGRLLPDGTVQDSWYMMGSFSPNHNLTAISNIVVSLQIAKGSKWRFSVSSGWDGVTKTSLLNPNGGKKSSYIEITGGSYAQESYTLSKSSSDWKVPSVKDEDGNTIELGPVDWSNITGYELYTDDVLNSSAEAIAGWEALPEGCLQKLFSVIVN